MADFDLTQTDQQVQNILNDGQSAMGAGAQTTLTTEYVMLKDTSGVYHKILKSSFTEAIRDVLAGLLVNNDKGTTINQIAAIASGDFGSITPANLASVLGEGYIFKSQEDTYTDLNDMRPGIFYNGNMPTIQNAPSTIISTSNPQCVVLCVKNGSGNRGMAFAFSALGVATRFLGAGGWTAWKSVLLT